MTARSKRGNAKAYSSVGTTSDGVRVLRPKTRPKSFTTSQIRATIRKVLRDRENLQARIEPDGATEQERSGRSN